MKHDFQGLVQTYKTGSWAWGPRICLFTRRDRGESQEVRGPLLMGAAIIKAMKVGSAGPGASVRTDTWGEAQRGASVKSGTREGCRIQGLRQRGRRASKLHGGKDWRPRRSLRLG